MASGDCRVFPIDRKLYSPVEVRWRGQIIPGILVEIHFEDGTVDVQTPDAYFNNLPPYEHGADPEGMYWQWPGAPEPEDPKYFKPNRWKR